MLALNPDATQPLLDGVMVAVTDYAIPSVAVLLTCWALGAELCLRRWASPRQLLVGVRGAGRRGSRWRAFAHFGATFRAALVPLVMTPILAGSFLAIGLSFGACDDDALARVRRSFWLALVAVLLTEVAVELILRLGPARPRPFASGNGDWNAALRVIPDEHVRRGGSFPSGHAGAICALLAPAFWIARRRALRVALLGLAALCVYSRVYLAAHFPSDALAGAAIGIAIGTLATRTLVERRGSSAAQRC